MIEVKDLSFSYLAGIPVLREINLNFDQRSTAIIGQNGTGKTTLVKLLKGLLKTTTGEIIISGHNTKELTVSQLSKHIGLVFQNPNDQIFKNNVLTEVEFGPLNVGKSTKEARELSLQALEMLNLTHLQEENPYDLSLSERKLISIASIIAMDTEIIILDEPTIAQDWLGKELIKKTIRSLEAAGKLVITIIHDMDFVADVFERTIVMEKGQVILDGPTRDVFAHDEILKRAYLEAPNVTQLCKQLGEKEVFLTVEEYINFRLNK